jgi:hypothetical protein
MNFKKLKQLFNDIDLLEQSGKYSAAKVLHKKFIKEAQTVNNIQNYQARPGTVNQRTVYPGQGNAFERGDNFARSERGGVGTLYNFKGLDPEKELATVPGVPGKSRQVLIPKGSDPRMADPAFAASQRTKSWENSIPGYVDFLRFKPQPYQALEFRQSGGLNSDAGKILYNELAVKAGQKPIVFPGYETQLSPAASLQAPTTQTQPSNVSATPVNQTPATQTPTTQTAVGKTPAIDPNYQGYQTPTTTNAPVQQAPSQPGTQPQGSSIPKLQERIDHYNKKIQEYKSVTDPKRKSEMFKYLNQYIKDNYDQGLLDPQSYRNLMTQLG